MTTTDTVRFAVHHDPDLRRALRLTWAQSRRVLSDIVDKALRLSLREDQERPCRGARAAAARLRGPPRRAQSL
jgi:hypothetical protein